MRYTKELLIGVTAIAAIICFVWGYNFLKGKNVFTMKRDYYAFYEHVHGLQVGQPVTINGFKIGIIGLICYSGYVIMFKQQADINLYSIITCILTFVILNKTKIHPIFLIVAAGLIGFFFEI